MIQTLHKKGFTLIELLIVIAILGILAVGLLAALDPLEQTRRASDASKRQLATEIIGAFDRYYAQKQIQAFCLTPECDQPLESVLVVAGSNVTNMNVYATNNLQSAGELKSNTTFASHPQAANVYVSRNNTAPYSAVVCWLPESKAQKTNAETKWTTLTGASTTPCTAAVCYQCIKQ